MRIRTIVAAVLVVLISAALPLEAAHAKTFAVPCGDVPALIAAINAANNEGINPGQDRINLGASCDYVLTAVNNTTDGPTGLPVITSNVMILGNGSTIRRSSAALTPSFRILDVATTGVLATNTLTVRNGLLDASGGGFSIAAGAGIFNQGTATLNTTSVRDNHVKLNDYIAVPIGGGLSNSGDMRLNFGDVTGNSAEVPPGPGFSPGAFAGIPLGGGIANTGALTVVQTTVADNSAGAFAIFAFSVGGGIASGASSSATVTVTGARILNNGAGSLDVAGLAIGGGIGADSLTLTGAEVAGNSTTIYGYTGPLNLAIGGGIATFGSTNVAKSSNIHDNNASVFAFGGGALGGGIANLSTLTISGSQVGHNLASASGTGSQAFGGGVQTTGTLIVNASTISENTADAPSGTARGGGLYNANGAKATLSGSSVTNNHATGSIAEGGGIYNAGAPGDVVLKGTSVSGNTPDNCKPVGSVPGCAG